MHTIGNGENREPCQSHSQKLTFFYTGTHIHIRRDFEFVFPLI